MSKLNKNGQIKALTRLQDELKSKRDGLLELNGKIKNIRASMKDEFGVSTVKKANQLLATMKEDMAAIQVTIDKQLEVLDTDYSIKLG